MNASSKSSKGGRATKKASVRVTYHQARMSEKVGAKAQYLLMSFLSSQNPTKLSSYHIPPSTPSNSTLGEQKPTKGFRIEEGGRRQTRTI